MWGQDHPGIILLNAICGLLQCLSLQWNGSEWWREGHQKKPNASSSNQRRAWMDERDFRSPYLLSTSKNKTKGKGLAELAGKGDPVEIDSSPSLWRDMGGCLFTNMGVGRLRQPAKYSNRFFLNSCEYGGCRKSARGTNVVVVQGPEPRLVAVANRCQSSPVSSAERIEEVWRPSYAIRDPFLSP